MAAPLQRLRNLEKQSLEFSKCSYDNQDWQRFFGTTARQIKEICDDLEIRFGATAPVAKPPAKGEAAEHIAKAQHELLQAFDILDAIKPRGDEYTQRRLSAIHETLDELRCGLKPEGSEVIDEGD